MYHTSWVKLQENEFPLGGQESVDFPKIAPFVSGERYLGSYVTSDGFIVLHYKPESRHTVFKSISRALSTNCKFLLWVPYHLDRLFQGSC